MCERMCECKKEKKKKNYQSRGEKASCSAPDYCLLYIVGEGPRGGRAGQSKARRSEFILGPA